LANRYAMITAGTQFVAWGQAIADNAGVRRLLRGWMLLVNLANLGRASDFVHDFGKLLPGGNWIHVFSFTNDSQQTLRFESAKASCSCLVAESWPRAVAAGKTGTVVVRLYSANARGPVSESLKLRLAGADKTDMTFAVSAFVQAPVEARPDFVTLRSDPSGRTNAFTFVQITNHLATEVMLTNAVSSTERFAVKLESIKAGYSYRLRIEAVPPFNSGNTLGTIVVNTSVKDFPRLEVTALVPAGQ